MRANIAHLLICNKAVKVLQDGGGCEFFINILDADEHKPYFNLGSIGPDLSYYGSNWEGLKNLFFDQSDKPLGVDGWSYLLRSQQQPIPPYPDRTRLEGYPLGTGGLGRGRF